MGRSLYPLPGLDLRDFGAKADDATDMSAAVTNALAALDRAVGGIVEIPPGKYYLGASVVIPKDFQEGAQVVIRGYGAQLRTDQAIAMIRRTPANQSEALNTMVGASIVVEGLRGVGSGLAGQTFIQLGATFYSRLIACAAVSCGVGFDLQFCLNARLEQCRANNSETHGFWIRTGTWSGADGFNSQSNHATLANCRTYSKTGAQTGFNIVGCNGVVLDSCITEGGDPVRNVLFDFGGTGVTRHFVVRNLHCENAPSGSHLYIKAQGTVELDGLWYQTGTVLVEWADSAHYTVVRNVPWVASQTPFKCANVNAGAYRFQNVGAGIDCTQAARWVGNAVPASLVQ